VGLHLGSFPFSTPVHQRIVASSGAGVVLRRVYPEADEATDPGVLLALSAFGVAPGVQHCGRQQIPQVWCHYLQPTSIR
jgi:hypothetical protein